MFVYYYTYVARPFDEIGQVLADCPRRLLGARTCAGGPGDGGVRLSLGTNAAFRLRKDVVINLGEPDRSDRRAILPLTVVAAGAPALFPRLEAELEFAPVDVGSTQLTLRGSYRPPLGPVGERLDEALLHRVTEAAIKELLDQVADRLVGEGAERPLQLGAIDS